MFGVVKLRINEIVFSDLEGNLRWWIPRVILVVAEVPRIPIQAYCGSTSEADLPVMSL
jgi:hypothetical protein